jgi:membrane-associated phospholipid phosphatase
MTASLTEIILTLAAFLAGVFVLRTLLWHGLQWLARAWTRGPELVRRGATKVHADQVGRWFAGRFPRTSEFLARRIEPEGFTGLPLTLIVCAAFYAVFLFGGLVEEMIESEGIRVVDEFIANRMVSARTPVLVAIFAWITDLGSMPTLTAVAIVASAFLLAHGPQRFVPPLWLTVIGSQVTTYSGKYILARPRPDFVLDVTAATPSFPSGHTTGALAVYGFIAYAVLRDLSSPRARFDVAFGAGILICLIALSRIFLGVHYSSDVAAGLLVGFFWLLAGIALAEIKRVSAPG